MNTSLSFQVSRGASFGAFVTLLHALSWAPPAHASPTFPAEVQKQLDMPCVPQCTLCHRDTGGGKGTVVRPFGQAMMAMGLEGKHPELIVTALGALEQGSADSDGDGTPDVTELREGKNPNQTGDGVLCATYGCSTRRRPAGGSSGPAMLVLVLAAPFVARVRRRCRRAQNAGASR